MATTHSRNRSHMPDLSASLDDNNSCAPLSDLWNFPKSKLFPANQQQPPPPPPATTSPQLAATSGATGIPSSGSAGAGTAAAATGTTTAAAPEPGDSIAPIGSAAPDLKMGHAHPHPAQPFTTTSLWSRSGTSSAGAVAAGVAALDLSSSGSSGEAHTSTHSSSVASSGATSASASVGPATNPPIATPELSSTTTPVVGPGVSAPAPSLLQLGPAGSPSTGSFRTQPAPRAGGIWGSEYSGFRHGHSAFSQAPASASRIVSGPFSLQKTGPVRTLDQPPSSPQPVVPALPVGLGAPSPAGARSLDSSWDRTAFSKPVQPQTPSTATAAATSPTVILSVHQQQQIHQQQQQQQQHRTQKKGGRPSTNTELYKTELCASYMSTGGNCPYGEKCQFAHGTQELKTVDRPPKWRSKPCQNWVKTGTCSYNERCCFRHDIPVSPPQ